AGGPHQHQVGVLAGVEPAERRPGVDLLAVPQCPRPHQGTVPGGAHAGLDRAVLRVVARRVQRGVHLGGGERRGDPTGRGEGGQGGGGGGRVLGRARRGAEGGG